MRIIYTNESGGVSVVIANSSYTTLEQFQELAKRVIPTGLPYKIVADEEVPTDRTFRDAWEQNSNGVSVNIPKAKDIAHSKRRDARAKEFAPLDVEATIPSMAQQAESKRQAIRDKYAVMQAKIDAAKTVEDLLNIVGTL